MQRTTTENTGNHSFSWKAGLLTLCFMVLGANNAFAQNCPAVMVGGFESPQPLYSLGEDIGIVLTLGTEYIVPLPDDTSTQYVDIRKFLYHLDCTPGDTINSCTWAGNDVVFDPEANSVWTDCKDTTGGDASPPVLKWTDDGLTVTFSADDAAEDAIRINSPASGGFASCEVGFDVRVNDLAPGNQDRNILEILGWFGTQPVPDGEPVPAVECSNNVPSTIVEQDIQISIANRNSSFVVRKDFTDDNPAAVDVHFRCNGGFLNLTEFSITDPATGGTFPYVRFLVYGMEDEGVNCNIYEDPIPTGYSESYLAGADEGAEYSDMMSLADGCYYEGVMGGEFTCDVTNTLDPTTVTVNKVWEGDALDHRMPLVAEVHWQCFNTGVRPSGGNVRREGTYTFEGATDSFDINRVYPSYKGDSYCTVDELITNSSVESDKSECDKVKVPLGADPHPSCTIYNTVFFEGIPTLSQYGLALMALLMLSVGLLGFRRFA